jgi:hypothetical protein
MMMHFELLNLRVSHRLRGDSKLPTALKEEGNLNENGQQEEPVGQIKEVRGEI